MTDTYSIGVDLGGTNLRIAAYAGGTAFLETITLPTRLAAGRDEVVRDLCEAVNALISRGYGNRQLAGIAIGTPGPLELPEGTLRNLPNFPGWDGFRLKAAITQTIRREIILENDANLAAFAEQQLGAGSRHAVENLCVITLGTGVGNGLILNGKIWDGANGFAGEAGHMIVRDAGELDCGCGGRGCLEQYASATGIVRMARESLGVSAPATAHDLAVLARSGDRKALGVFKMVGNALAIALTGLINTLNLPLYLLGGGVCEAWDLFSPAMFHELQHRSYVYRLTKPGILEPDVLEARKTYILKAQLGSTAGLLGACILGLESALTTPMEEFLAHYHQ